MKLEGQIVTNMLFKTTWSLFPKVDFNCWSFPPPTTKYMANDDFSKPPRHADSKNPIFIFCRIVGLGHLWGLGVGHGRILGDPSVEPFFEGRGLARGLY